MRAVKKANAFKFMKKIKAYLFLLVYATNLSAQNYDEAKVPPYTLPELLTTFNGQNINNASDWENKRRPEIVMSFQNNIYGQMPGDFDSLKFKITNESSMAMKGKAHLKQVTITAWRKDNSVDINLILFTPTRVPKSAPVFLLINNRDKRNTDAARDTLSQFWPAEMAIDSGYAIAAFHVSDAAPDDKLKYVNGVLKLYPEQLTADHGMKAIGAWAWAASRVMDYFEKDQHIDASRVGIVGHSRGGKAALWAGAQDKRFAIVFSNCSGNTGAALSKRIFGETVKRINDQFPHWFANNYKKFNDNETALPVDQHMLITLIAPRPVYTTNASKDLWADPKGSFLAIKNAEKVYALYGKTSALPLNPPPVNTPVLNSILGYHNREGIHDLTAFDWANFIRFADYHYYKK